MEDEVCLGKSQNRLGVSHKCVNKSIFEPAGKRAVKEKAIFSGKIDEDIPGASMTFNQA